MECYRLLGQLGKTLTKFSTEFRLWQNTEISFINRNDTLHTTYAFRFGDFA